MGAPYCDCGTPYYCNFLVLSSWIITETAQLLMTKNIFVRRNDGIIMLLGSTGFKMLDALTNFLYYLQHTTGFIIILHYILLSHEKLRVHETPGRLKMTGKGIWR